MSVESEACVEPCLQGRRFSRCSRSWPRASLADGISRLLKSRLHRAFSASFIQGRTPLVAFASLIAISAFNLAARADPPRPVSVYHPDLGSVGGGKPRPCLAKRLGRSLHATGKPFLGRRQCPMNIGPEGKAFIDSTLR